MDVDIKRTTGKYKNRGIRYVHMKAGHAAQNVYLQAVSLNLGTVVIGAFDDKSVRNGHEYARRRSASIHHAGWQKK